MSIIQEALKKAQWKTGSPEGAITKRPGDKLNSMPAGKNTVGFMLYALALVALIAVFAIKYFPAVRTHAQVSVAKIPTALPEVKQEVAAKPPVALPASEPAPAEWQVAPAQPSTQPSVQRDEFVLSGIMHLDGTLRAIINNSTVGEGDGIGGAVVEAINEDEVVLTVDGSRIVLRIK